MGDEEGIASLAAAIGAYRAGELQAAAAACRELIGREPGNVEALRLAGTIAQELGRLERAREYFSSALAHCDQDAQLWNALGATEYSAGNVVAARSHLERALQLDPGCGPAWMNLALAWQVLGNAEAADEACARALQCEPGNRTYLRNIAGMLVERRLYAEAAALYQHIAMLAGDVGVIADELAFVKQHLCDWDGLDRLHEAMQRVPEFANPFNYLSFSNSAAQNLEVARQFAGQMMVAPGEATRPPFPELSDGRLRVAYWSCDFQEHATTSLLAEVIELHDRSRIELFMLSYGRDDGGPMRHRLKATGHRFIDAAAMNLGEVAQLVRNHGIHILVDLKGYTGQSRCNLLALRPAPIQASWLGFPGTLGSEHADYIIADDFIIPPELERHYTERVARMPVCYQPNDRSRKIGFPLPRSAHGLPENAFVFCSFNQASKILPAMFATWMRILQGVPESVLWLLSVRPDAEQNLRREAVRHGVDPARLVFTHKVTHEQHLARYRVADLALDTFPYGSHTTASDALWAGCPLVALAGETFPSRVSGSILRAAGLPELIAYSMGEFESLAVAIATDRERLAGLRARLKASRDSVPLFDSRRFARDLEDLFFEMAAAAER